MKNQYKQKLLFFFDQNKILVFFSFAIAFLTYGYEIFNFTLSIDEEGMLANPDEFMNTWLLTNRWTTFLLNKLLFNGKLLPFLPTLISVVGLVLSILLYLDSIKTNLISKIVFVTIAISFPANAHFLSFNTINHAFGVGFILITTSYLFTLHITEKLISPQYLIISSGLFALATGIYQSISTIYIFMIATQIFFLFENHNSNYALFKRLVKYSLLTIVLGFIIHKTISMLFLWIHLGFLSFILPEYLENYIVWGKKDTLEILILIVKYIGRYFIGKGFSGGSFMILFLVLALYASWIKIRQIKIKRSNFISLVGLIIIMLSPFTFIIFTGSHLATWSLVSLPFTVAFIWLISYNYLHGSIFKIVFLIVLGIVFIKNATTTTELFFTNHITMQADRNMAQSLADRIFSLKLDNTQKSHPVAIIGKYNSLSLKSMKKDHIFGTSFFSWDDGNPSRILDFLKISGISKLHQANEMQMTEALKKSNSMPGWPYTGSVILYKGTIIVKLSDEFPLK